MEIDDDDGVTPPHVGGFRLRWDVFLSFRGEDTRETITKKLYEELQRYGVRAFLDNDGMDRGDDISHTLLAAIKDSAAAIVVLSENYANSRWCLSELAEICDGSRRLILPLFYGVDPSHVRRQEGKFKDHFEVHEQVYDNTKVSMWRTAMAKVGGKAGYVFDIPSDVGTREREEAVLTKKIVKRVLTEMERTPMGLTPFPVGLDSRVEEVMDLLDVGTKSIQVVGLHGMGGIGKTTLAKALFNRLVGYFERHSFISNVRESSAGDDDDKGLVSLQNKLISDLSSNKKVPADNIRAGIVDIKAAVNENRVLVVLDDVDNVNQLSALVGNGHEWFHEGSRIIVTTRDTAIVPSHLVNYKLYEIKELDKSHALELFSHHALGRRQNPADHRSSFLDLAEQIVALTTGLPTLEVVGSSLFDKRRIEEWTDTLDKLKKIQPGNVQDVLMISYNALDEQDKCIFLDIACLFIKMKMNREEAIVILKGCGFNGELAIKVLISRSLLKITPDTKLWMHDQLRDMGTQIVKHENLLDPGMCSRLWDRHDILNVFKDNKGTRSIQGIVLDFERKHPVRDPGGDRISWNNFRRSLSCTSGLTYLKERKKAHLQSQAEKNREVTISSQALGAMINLRLLQINHVKLEGNLKPLPSEVKWLQWKSCPLSSFPPRFFPRELAVLDLSDSNITSLWGGCPKNKVAENLMFLILRNCIRLTAIPDLSGNRALQQLDLEHCISLTKLHDSIGSLNTLVDLNLQDCSKLVQLPSDVSGLKKLENLILSGCSQLKTLPKNMDRLVSVKQLLLEETAIESLPQCIFRLTKL